MASDYSFDVVSEFDQQELRNAVDQARREVGTRFDFRGITAEFEMEKDALVLLSGSDMHLKSMVDILQSKFHKRNLDLRILDPQKIEPAAKGDVRQRIGLRHGIGEDEAKTLQKRIKSSFPKVVAKIQGDQLRVSSKDKDTLQDVIADLKSADVELPLQFTNYR